MHVSLQKVRWEDQYHYFICTLTTRETAHTVVMSFLLKASRRRPKLCLQSSSPCASNFTFVMSTEPGITQSMIWQWHAPVGSYTHNTEIVVSAKKTLSCWLAIAVEILFQADQPWPCKLCWHGAHMPNNSWLRLFLLVLSMLCEPFSLATISSSIGQSVYQSTKKLPFSVYLLFGVHNIYT